MSAQTSNARDKYANNTIRKYYPRPKARQPKCIHVELRGTPWDSVGLRGYPWVSVGIRGYPWTPWTPWVSVGIRGIRGYPWVSVETPWDSVDSGDSGNLRVGLRGTPPDCRNIRKIHCFCDLAMDGADHAQQIAQWQWGQDVALCLPKYPMPETNMQTYYPGI